jgi:hypothetical protein
VKSEVTVVTPVVFGTTVHLLSSQEVIVITVVLASVTVEVESTSVVVGNGAEEISAVVEASAVEEGNGQYVV